MFQETLWIWQKMETRLVKVSEIIQSITIHEKATRKEKHERVEKIHYHRH